MDKKRLAIVITCLIIFFAIFWLPWIIYWLMSLAPDLAPPEITYAEFPIHIEYYIGDEKSVVDDVFICEFIGYKRASWLESINIGSPQTSRQWEGALKYGAESNRIILFSNGMVTVDYLLGNAYYYMNDWHAYSKEPQFRVFEYSPSRKMTEKIISIEELKDYGIEIIDCVLPEPLN